MDVGVCVMCDVHADGDLGIYAYFCHSDDDDDDDDDDDGGDDDDVDDDDDDDDDDGDDDDEQPNLCSDMGLASCV